MAYEGVPEIQCHGKQKYQYEETARKEVAKIERRGRHPGVARVTAYKCPHCPAWHIGGEPSAETKKMNREANARRHGWIPDAD